MRRPGHEGEITPHEAQQRGGEDAEPLLSVHEDTFSLDVHAAAGRPRQT
jgi:hypothetical protein